MSRRVSRGRIAKKIRGQAAGRIDCLMKLLRRNSGTEMERVTVEQTQS